MPLAVAAGFDQEDLCHVGPHWFWRRPFSLLRSSSAAKIMTATNIAIATRFIAAMTIITMIMTVTTATEAITIAIDYDSQA